MESNSAVRQSVSREDIHALIHETQEDKWIATAERKYYEDDKYFIKRSLKPSEFLTGYRGIHVPPLGKQRLMNEAASLRFIGENTNIPVPAVYHDFEDDGAYYVVTEFVDGISMARLTDDQRAMVSQELERHRAELQRMTSARLGGPTGIVIPPYRVLRHAENDTWNLRSSTAPDYVFCHNDLSQQNVIVDPKSLKIKAIIDWEYAGFFPSRFDYPFYQRLGPSAAINDETDDSLILLEFLRSQACGSGNDHPAA
ncbi:hypothetical protein K4F52_004283 [Lecanicillium sp. MT-2017a]|nr:hypothetical protein K4F52_004283 [Lecanicillium sp. MT-2017a]